MMRWIGAGVAFALASAALLGAVRNSKLAAGTPAGDAGGAMACAQIITTNAGADIAAAQARLRAVPPGDSEARAREVARLDTVLRCQAARNPTDGRIFALLAWTAWRTDQPPARIAALVARSYELHPFEIDTIAVRHVVVAGNWASLGEDLHEIGRADQNFRLASRSVSWIIPELAVLYAEAGTSSDLYFEALDWLARKGPEHARELETRLLEIRRGKPTKPPPRPTR